MADDGGSGGDSDIGDPGPDPGTRSGDVNRGETGGRGRSSNSIGGRCGGGRNEGSRGNAWDKGNPLQEQRANMDFHPVEFIFKDPNTPTKEEIAELNLTRSFFLIQKSSNQSVDDIIEQIRFEDLNKSEELSRMIPRSWLRIKEEVHMSYVSVKGLSDSIAKKVMDYVAPNLLKANLFLLNGVDTAGNLTTSSKHGIDTVVYFATQKPHQPNPKDFMSAVKNIVKDNTTLSTLLECTTPPDARYCLLIGNILGVSQAAILDGFTSPFIRTSNLLLDTTRYTRDTKVVTSNPGRINLTLPRHEQIPKSVKVTTWSGGSAEIIVTHHFEYGTYQPSKAQSAPSSAHASNEPASVPKFGQHPRHKTKICYNPSSCHFGPKCLFAHDKSELRPLPNTTHADAAPISAFPMASALPMVSGSNSTLAQQHVPALSDPGLSKHAAAWVLAVDAHISAQPIASSSNSTPALSVLITPPNTPLAPSAPESALDPNTPLAPSAPESALDLNAFQSPLNAEPENISPVHGAEDDFIASVKGKTSPIGRQNPSVSAYKQPPTLKWNVKGPHSQQTRDKGLKSPITAQPLPLPLPSTPLQPRQIVIDPIPPLPSATFQTPPQLKVKDGSSANMLSSRTNGKHQRAQGSPETISPKEAQAIQKKKKLGLSVSPTSKD